MLTGCNTDYTINVNNDLSVDEKASIEETYYYFEENYTYYHSSEVLDLLWDQFSDKYKDNSYTYTHNSSETGIYVKASYKNIDEFVNKNKIYNQFFEKIDYTKKQNQITLETKGEFYPYNEQDPEKFAIESTKINIVVPFKVISNNADQVSGNKYTWYINKDTKDKKIKITFDTSNSQIKKQSKNYYLIIIGIGIFIGIIILYISYKIKRADNEI